MDKIYKTEQEYFWAGEFGNEYIKRNTREKLLPNELNSVYEKMYQSSAKYILISEYYNPTPVSVTYRGNENKLFKRDFAGEMMDKYPELKLVDYGFRYHRDNNFKSDDDTWFLLEK